MAAAGGAVSALIVTTITTATALAWLVERRLRRGRSVNRTTKEYTVVVGLTASLVFGIFFALFTYWSFAWTEARSPFWLIVWFTVAWLPTFAACHVVAWLASRSNTPLQPTTGGKIEVE